MQIAAIIVRKRSAGLLEVRKSFSHVNEDVDVNANGDDDDSKAPTVGECVAEFRLFSGDPTPIAADRLHHFHCDGRCA